MGDENPVDITTENTDENKVESKTADTNAGEADIPEGGAGGETVPQEEVVEGNVPTTDEPAGGPKESEGAETPGDDAEIPGEGSEIPGEVTDKEGVMDEEERTSAYGSEEIIEADVEEEAEVEDELQEEIQEEEQGYKEPEVDPTAPLNLSDSAELKRPPFKLRADQLAEVEEIWQLYQNYTYVYAELDNYITIKELRYMLEGLLLMTYTEEQFYELLEFCVREPDPDGWEFTKITYEQFLQMVIIRWRDMNVEEELRIALKALDKANTGELDADYLRELMGNMGHKLNHKIIEGFIKEVDLAGEGKIGIEDIIGICSMDLQTDEMFGPKMPEDYKQAKPDEIPGEGGHEEGPPSDHPDTTRTGDTPEDGDEG